MGWAWGAAAVAVAKAAPSSAAGRAASLARIRAIAERAGERPRPAAGKPRNTPTRWKAPAPHAAEALLRPPPRGAA